MKRFIATILIASSLFFGFSAQASYDFVSESGLKKTGENLGYETDQNSDIFVESYLGQVLTVIFSILGLIFFVLIIYAGFLWMTAQGNDSKVGEAKKVLTNAIIGLVVVLASYAISYFVFSALTPAAETATETTAVAEE
ncbi:MAG: pilin [Candidatus Parcubacteria bacterium]|jgi:preprotein translocase subunit SecG|nr:MAG: hypothetical protein JST_6380 [Candidatus Parcubacteria bacterium]